MIIDFDSKNKGGGGKEPVVESLSVTENGTYNAPSGVDGYNPVNVNVPQREPVLESLSVTDNGTYTPSAGKDGFDSVDVNVPKEHHNVTSKSITANGVYNSTGDDVWNSVDVNVPSREPVLESLSVTDNGTYTPSTGVDGYNSVSVNVPKEHHNVTSKSITANGVYNSTGDEVWNEVSVNVPQSGGFDTKLLRDLSITIYDENMNKIRNIDVSGSDFSNVQSLQSFASWNDSLKTVNMSNCTFTSRLSSISYMFQGSTSIETIDFTNCDFSHADGFNSSFDSYSLTTIISDGLKLPNANMDNTGLSTSPKLTVDSIVGLLNALPTTTNGYSFQIGQTNIDKLSEEQKAIATTKGWQLV